LRAELPRILAAPPEVLLPRMVRIIGGLTEDWRRLDERIDCLSSEVTALARQDAGCERLVSVPGIGPIISSAMVAAIGTGEAFSKGRDFAAWLGLVPKQFSTGDRTILGKISKRGNRYLRVLFVHAPQRACHRARQQARPDRMERAGSQSHLRGQQASGRVVFASSSFTRQGLREDEKEMEVRSSRRMRNLVTQMVR
jgi:transposase